MNSNASRGENVAKDEGTKRGSRPVALTYTGATVAAAGLNKDEEWRGKEVRKCKGGKGNIQTYINLWSLIFSFSLLFLPLKLLIVYKK